MLDGRRCTLRAETTASAISSATPSWASVVLAPRCGVHTTSERPIRGLSGGGGSFENTSSAACARALHIPHTAGREGIAAGSLPGSNELLAIRKSDTIPGRQPCRRQAPKGMQAELAVRHAAAHMDSMASACAEAVPGRPGRCPGREPGQPRL